MRKNSGKTPSSFLWKKIKDLQHELKQGYKKMLQEDKKGKSKKKP